MAGDGAAEQLAEVLRELRAASGLTYGDIIHRGKRRTVKFTQASLSNWFDGTSVPSDPRTFRTLVELMDTQARKKPGYPPTDLDVLEQLRRDAEAQRRPRRTAVSHPEASPVAAEPSAQQAPPPAEAAAPGDAAKAGRVLAALPHRANWLGLLRDPEYFPIHVTVFEAFRLACERVPRDVVDFVDPALHEAHTALLGVMAELEQFIGDWMFGPDPGRPWIDLGRYCPDRETNLPVLAEIRSRLDTRYRALVNALSQRGLLWEPGQPTTAVSPGSAAAPADAVVRAARLATKRWAPLDHLEKPRDDQRTQDPQEWIKESRRRTAYQAALRELHDRLDALASYLPLTLGPRPTPAELALVIEQAQRFHNQQQ
ncbi:hypothetical protein OH807_00020 [Kitasatospora sp. NBC_01560]|uniref:hypothetical protein n=1 Tax=Kitasatospora sp. NBC_01560 TaxID=2975965 RepID=UPI00386EF4EC